MFGRWRRKRDTPPPPPPQSDDELLAEVIAGHFDGATVDGRTVELGFAGARIECRVNAIRQAGGGYHAASLFFRVSGGLLGGRPTFASVSGYAPDPRGAIVIGACNWACVFGPVLRAGLTNSSHPDVEEDRVTIDGREYRLLAAGLDRAIMFSDLDETDLIRDARLRLGGELALRVAQSGRLPALAAHSATLLSVFLRDGADGRIREVKVNGVDWEPASRVFADAEAGPDGGVALLRELAVLVPVDLGTGPEPIGVLSRPALERTLAGLPGRAVSPASTAGWRGWRLHGGALAPALGPDELAGLDARIGPLPADYRDFLGTTAASGAGPGYGLLPPGRVEDVVPLGHAGCGVTWVLRLDPGHHGEVWVDAAGSDQGYRRVAGSFGEWYRSWLTAAVREDGPWLHWDISCCAPVSLLNNLLNEHGEAFAEKVRFGPGSITSTGGGGYLPADSALDPCQGCLTMADQLGVAEETFALGLPTGGENA
ncbi:SMI1/KNR4 family protein [Longispora sp. K20-0274]|uniref:SMI1/KNR4 family protein n=1 Tax=Longispora sp. K20-0274 TaxID=3088255 RepID=UPI003999A115